MHSLHMDSYNATVVYLKKKKKKSRHKLPAKKHNNKQTTNTPVVEKNASVNGTARNKLQIFGTDSFY